jgi:hypothetical protein
MKGIGPTSSGSLSWSRTLGWSRCSLAVKGSTVGGQPIKTPKARRPRALFAGLATESECMLSGAVQSSVGWLTTHLVGRWPSSCHRDAQRAFTSWRLLRAREVRYCDDALAILQGRRRPDALRRAPGLLPGASVLRRARRPARRRVGGLDAAGDYEWRAATSSDGSVRPGTASAAPDTGEPTTIMEESSA